MALEIGGNVVIGGGITYGNVIIVVDITTQNNDQLITESGNNITTEQF